MAFSRSYAGPEPCASLMPNFTEPPPPPPPLLPLSSPPHAARRDGAPSAAAPQRLPWRNRRRVAAMVTAAEEGMGWPRGERVGVMGILHLTTLTYNGTNSPVTAVTCQPLS